jgi:cobalamin biosynthesis Mg chelatase CobN
MISGVECSGPRVAVGWSELTCASGVFAAQSRNAFSFGRGKEKGVMRQEVLKELLSTTNRIVQEIDSVEYGLTDIQEYYANTGALKKAAEVSAPRHKPEPRVHPLMS